MEGPQGGWGRFRGSRGADFTVFFVHDVGEGRRMLPPVNGVGPRLDDSEYSKY